MLAYCFPLTLAYHVLYNAYYWSHTRTHKHTHLHAFMHSCAHTHAQTHAHTHTHTMHAHSRSQGREPSTPPHYNACLSIAWPCPLNFSLFFQCIAASAVVVGYVTLQNESMQENLSSSPKAEGSRMSEGKAPPPPRKNAVLVIGATGRTGRETVQQVCVHDGERCWIFSSSLSHN